MIISHALRRIFAVLFVVFYLACGWILRGIVDSFRHAVASESEKFRAAAENTHSMVYDPGIPHPGQ